MTWQGMVSLVSADGMHQLHIFVFFLAVFHVTFSFFTMSLGRAKVWSVLLFPPKSGMDKSCELAVTLNFVSTQTRIWKVWEKETCLPTYEFQYGTVLFDLLIGCCFIWFM
jgi:mlo protein